jgi:homocysteine S-methyltransferase
VAEVSRFSAGPPGRRAYVTDGGIETDLIYRRGAILREFAAFPLVETSDGRALLREYYDDYAGIAHAHDRGLFLESPTWRANPDWGRLLGQSAGDLARVNVAAIDFLADLRRSYGATVGADIVVSGTVGPRSDGYSASTELGPDDAEAYHRPQIAAFAAAGADLVTAHTITHVGEAVGIVRAARYEGLPVAVSFTVETDGRLASGMTLADAITHVDAVAAPDYFLVNCAHPRHIEAALTGPSDWFGRIVGTRANASDASHADLDAAVERGDGDPAEFADAQRHLMIRLPHLRIVGGCCGTDARHVAAASALFAGC